MSGLGLNDIFFVWMFKNGQLIEGIESPFSQHLDKMFLFRANFPNFKFF